ncbi:MAG: MGH1-like glycoside hydrolase domain-containing protein, partial [Mangrovicoccus sp.]
MTEEITAERAAEIDAEAVKVMRLNSRDGYTVPTAGLYPYQWNWDSMFAALGFAIFDLDRAWTEVNTLLAGQWPDGMVPHILFHKPDPGYFPGPDIWGTEGKGAVASSGISQPPVAATMVRQIWERDKTRPEAGPVLEALIRWHRWFMEWRLDEGAVCIAHPWEAGRDNAPDWDKAMAAIDPTGVTPYARRDTSHVDPSMRPTKEDYDRYVWLVQHGRERGWDQAQMLADCGFHVADPGMTFILLGATRDLVAMGQEMGRDMSEA